MSEVHDQIISSGISESAQGKYVFDVSNRSLVFLKGKDGLDLLQRLSTNEVSQLKLGESVQTVLTNEKGKIIDVISVLKLRADELMLAGNTFDGEPLRAWLEKYIIMEDAAVENVTPQYAHFLLFGGQTDLNGIQIGTTDHHQFTERWGGQTLRHLICPVSVKTETWAGVQEHGYRKMEETEFNAFRVEHTIPAHPEELSSDYNAMEAGLMDLISFTKGCYIGQEVIARLDTYKKVQKRFVKLELGARPETVPIPIFDDREEVGLVTSIGRTTENGIILALGYMKSSLVEKSNTLFFLNQSQPSPAKLIS